MPSEQLPGITEGTGLSSRRVGPRVPLFFLAVALGLAASGISGIGFVVGSTVLLVVGAAFWLVWFGVLFMVAIPATDRLLKNQMGWLRRVAVAIFVALLVVGLLEALAIVAFRPWFGEIGAKGSLGQSLAALAEGFAYNDSTALSHQAAENLLRGENPYEKANIVSAFREFGGTSERLTPLRVGRFAQDFPYPALGSIERLWQEALENPAAPPPPEIESRLCYPAGVFLLPVPFLLAGVSDIRLVYGIFVVAALAIVTWLLPRGRRLVFAGAALISIELWDSIANGETGALCFPFLLLGWVLPRKSLWLSALFMGVAVATKQTAWFFLPFYLIMVVLPRGNKALSVLGIILGVFVAANLPFVVMDPGLWFSSVMAPLAERMFPLGVGMVTLVTGGLWDIRSSLVFGLVELGVFGLGIAWYFRNYRRYPQVAPVLAILPLFFAWRSLWSYFFYADIIMLAGILMEGAVVKGDSTSCPRSALLRCP
jgi:hypothetical protein